MHLNEIFGCLVQAFRHFWIDAREPMKEIQCDKMVSCHDIFAAITSCSVFDNFLFPLMTSTHLTAISTEFFLLMLMLLYHFFHKLLKLKLCLLFHKKVLIGLRVKPKISVKITLVYTPCITVGLCSFIKDVIYLRVSA